MSGKLDNLDLQFIPERKIHLLERTQRFIRKQAHVHTPTGVLVMLGLALGLMAISVSFSLLAEPWRAPLNANVATPTVEVPLSKQAERQLGDMEWSDSPSDLFLKELRLVNTTTRRGRLVARLAVRANDGFWNYTLVGEHETVPNTAYTVVRVDPRLTVVRDPAGVLHRVFIPSEWPLVKQHYGFRDGAVNSYLVELSQTALWAPITGTRTILGVELQPNRGVDNPAEFAKLVPELEQFAVSFAHRSARNPTLDVAAELASFLQQRGITNYTVNVVSATGS